MSLAHSRNVTSASTERTVATVQTKRTHAVSFCKEVQNLGRTCCLQLRGVTFKKDCKTDSVTRLLDFIHLSLVMCVCIEGAVVMCAVSSTVTALSHYTLTHFSCNNNHKSFLSECL